MAHLFFLARLLPLGLATLPPPELPPATGTLGEQISNERQAIGLEVGIEVASVFCFRGLNVFQSSSQLDQHFLFAPSASYAIGTTGLTLSYWSAYQLNGSNRSELVAAGVGNEQDLVVAYELALPDDRFSVGTSLTWYAFPFARRASAGTVLPSYLEPAVSVSFSGPVELTLNLAYFVGVQESLRNLSYLYVQPQASRSFELSSGLELSVGLSFGYKAFPQAPTVLDNVFDVQLDWELSMVVAPGLSISPAGHVAWTNMADKPLGSEHIVWGGIKAELQL